MLRGSASLPKPTSVGPGRTSLVVSGEDGVGGRDVQDQDQSDNQQSAEAIVRFEANGQFGVSVPSISVAPRGHLMALLTYCSARIGVSASCRSSAETIDYDCAQPLRVTYVQKLHRYLVHQQRAAVVSRIASFKKGKKNLNKQMVRVVATLSSISLVAMEPHEVMWVGYWKQLKLWIYDS